MLKTLLLLAGSLISLHVYADLSITDFQNNRKTDFVNTYLQGLTTGLDTANNKLKTINQTPMYCYPPYLNLTTKDYREIIDLGIRDMGPNSLSGRGVDDLLLEQLIKLYPCGYN